MRTGRRGAAATVAALAILGTMALVGCGSSGGRAAPAGRATATAPAAQPSQAAPAVAPVAHITFCVPAKTDTTLVAFAAQDGGFLAKQHIRASLPLFAGSRVTQALVAGQCDFVLGSGAEGPALKGVDIVVIAVTSTRSPFGIWARPALRTIQDLKGHTLATSGPGSLSWRVGRFYLQQNHLVPDRDVNLFTVTGAGPTLAALLNGGVDAAVLSPPLSFEAQAKGMRLLYGGSRTPPFVVQTVTTTRRYLTAHQSVARGVVQAVAQAMERLRADRSFYGQELARFTNVHATGQALQRFWQNARADYNIPPVATRVEAVRALSLYATASGSTASVSAARLDQVEARWLDMSIVHGLYSETQG